MITWVMIVLIVYAIGLFTPALFTFFKIGIGPYMGSRDMIPEESAVHARSGRAHRNFMESLPVFLGLAALAYAMEGSNMALAIQGATLFAIARIAYLPLYVMAVPWLRSGAWIAGFIGLILMGLALV